MTSKTSRRRMGFFFGVLKATWAHLHIACIWKRHNQGYFPHGTLKWSLAPERIASQGKTKQVDIEQCSLLQCGTPV